jgi:hypothetical protein
LPIADCALPIDGQGEELGKNLPPKQCAIGGGQRFVPKPIEECSNLSPVIPNSSCSIRLRAPPFVVKLFFVGITANFVEELRAHCKPGPTPQTGNRRFGAYNSFKQIHGRKNISDK